MLVLRGVHARERAKHLARDVHRERRRERAPLLLQPAEQPIAIDAVDVLHREVRLALLVHPRAEHRHDVLVGHRGVEGGLALEHRPPLRVADEVGEEALHDESLRLLAHVDRAREVHLRRPADGEARLEPVGPEPDGPAREWLWVATLRRLFARHGFGKSIVHARLHK